MRDAGFFLFEALLGDVTADFVTGLESVLLDLDVEFCAPAHSSAAAKGKSAKLIKRVKHTGTKFGFFNRIARRRDCDFTLKLRKFYIDFLRPGRL